jgi:competence protein ComEC
MVRLRWATHLSWGLLAWVGGVALQLQQSVLWPALAYALLAVAAVLVLRARHVLAVCTGLAALAFALTGGHALWRSASISPALEGRDLDVVGVVQAMPQRQDAGWRFRIRIEQAQLAGQMLEVPGQVPAHVYLGWYAASMRDDTQAVQVLPATVQPGERWRFRVRLKAPHGQRNPRGFDYELWLWEQGIQATGYVRQGRTDPPPDRLGSSLTYPVEWARQQVRDRLLMRLDGAAGDGLNVAGILAALVTGDQAAIDRSDWDVFRATGVSHLMSISGVHVTMLAWLAAAVASGLWRRSALWGRDWPLRWPAPQVGAVVGVSVAALYALFSGWGVPAQRTVWMLTVVALLRLSARDWHWRWVWGLAAAVVVTLDPWALLQPGFWLSFVAVGVLLATDRPVQETAAPPVFVPERTVMEAECTDRVPIGPAKPKAWLGAILVRAGALLREQLVVTLALTPLTVLFFGQVSLIGLLANLVAIPWITLVVTPLALLGILLPVAWDLASACLRPLASLLAWMAAWPGASWQMPMPPWPVAVLALAGATALLLRGPWSWRVWGLPLVLPALFWVAPRPPPGSFELLAADVGQGNAVLVRTAHHSLLYDAGPRYSPESDAGHRVLVPLLAQMGEQLDVLMLSHRDSDHTGGAAAVLAMQPQARLWSSLEDEHPLLRGRPSQRCEAGQRWAWDGVLFEVLHPLAQDFEHPRKSNALSCVLRIRGTQGAALLAGDIEAPQERELLARGLDPVDFWLVPHHGSKTSSTPELLQALQPTWALAQAGYRNRFGHPATVVVSRYRAEGIAWADSAHCGAATWRSDEPHALRCERAENPRYWHHMPPP